ncbi:MAG TPA: hypothetical protein VFH88_03515, partial [Candidatus Krumholzibacteria bacterium]|nr:hypothetical protein [Candidatus Krumholzibacteria bacterium]
KVEWLDDFTVEVDDSLLDGQPGYVYVKLHYRFTSDGSSTYSPTAEAYVGPRTDYHDPYFFIENYNSGSTFENDWEVPLFCRFNRVAAPIDAGAKSFAAATADAGVTVTASLQWLGITRVTTSDGTPVSNYRICTASGTDYSGPLGAAPSMAGR